jgi:hypothetical protein
LRGPFVRVFNVETLAEHLGVFEQAILLSLGAGVRFADQR